MAAEDENLKLVTLKQIKEAYDVVKESPLCVRTPLLQQVQSRFYNGPQNMELFLKLESTQVTGSFKTRGVSNQFAHLDGEKPLVTMSAGNYGKAMCYAAQKFGFKATVIMPKQAPKDRQDIMENFGAKVIRKPTCQLQPTVDDYVKEGHHYLHSFDDLDVIAGHGSAGLEILEDLPDPDVIAVCCGGGGLAAGISAAVKLSGRKDTRLYCVEPETANCMYLSFKEGRAVDLPSSHSVASGLSPPFAGKNTYNHCKHFVEDVLLVTDEEIIKAMRHLYERGLVVEPAGAAAFAALLCNRIPDVEGKKVVIVITGANVSPQEMCLHSTEAYMTKTFKGCPKKTKRAIGQKCTDAYRDISGESSGKKAKSPPKSKAVISDDESDDEDDSAPTAPHISDDDGPPTTHHIEESSDEE